MDLSHTQLFRGIAEEDVRSMLQCLGARERAYERGEVILSAGNFIDEIGMVLEGMVLIEHSDVWGNNSVLGSVGPGAVFGEAYACLPGEPLMIHAAAAEHTRVLFLQVARVLETCSNACAFHARLVRNLLSVCAHKNLLLSRRILHTGPKSIRARLLSYFSECVTRAGSYTFSIPYNRQQLADYLGVDRSTMCNELSKMGREGLIAYHKNEFTIKNLAGQGDV